MLPTAAMSMWISNNATTAMMLPIMEAVMGELEADRDDEEGDGEVDRERVGKGKCLHCIELATGLHL